MQTINPNNSNNLKMRLQWVTFGLLPRLDSFPREEIQGFGDNISWETHQESIWHSAFFAFDDDNAAGEHEDDQPV